MCYKGAASRYPGLPGWGAKSSAHLEAIPPNPRDWPVNAANASRLARTLAEERDRAFLFRDLATLRTDFTLFDSVDALRWKGPTSEFKALAAELDGVSPGNAT